MALTRKLLKSMGIEDEKIEQIIEAHTETVEALKDERDEYKEKADKFDGVQKELEGLKAKGDESPYKVKYEAIKEEYENFKKEVEGKETHATKEQAFRQILKECGISEKRIDSVVKVSGELIDSLDIDKDGKVKDKAKISGDVKNEWADFIVKTETKGAETSNPPASDGKSGMTKDEILNIKDTAERQKAIAENHELFNF